MIRLVMRRLSPVLLLMAALFGLASAPARATHFRYGSISWQCAPNNSHAVTFHATFTFRRSYFAQNNLGTPVLNGPLDLATYPWNLADGTNYPTSAPYVGTTYTVTAEDLTADTVTAEATWTHTYAASFPSGQQFNVFNTGCCRLSTLQGNLNDQNWDLETIVTLGPGEASAVTTVPAVINIEQSAVATLFVPATDPNSTHTLKWRFATGPEQGVPLPVIPLGMTINPSTGEIIWQHTNLSPFAAGQLWSVTVMIENYSGLTLISKVPADFILKLVPFGGTPPSVTISPNQAITVLPNTPISFTITGTDNDPNVFQTLNSNGIPPGSTTTPALPLIGATGHPVATTFHWTPTAAEVGTHVLSFTTTASNGLQGIAAITVNVSAFQPPTATVGITPVAPTPFDTLTAATTATDPQGLPLTYTYQWIINGVVAQTTPNTKSTTDTLALPGLAKTDDDISVNVTANNGYLNSIPGMAIIDVIGAPTTTVVSGTPDPSVYGQSVTLHASVTSPDGTPTGTMQFAIAGQPLGNPVSLDSSGTASLPELILPAGPYAVTATYSGDTLFAASVGTFAQTVKPASTSTALASNLNPSAFGQPVTFSVTVASTAPGAGIPTGTVLFTVDGTARAPVVLDGSGNAAFSTASLSVGPHPVTASYSGDANNGSSASNPVIQTVKDVTPPVITVPADITVPATGPAGAVVSFITSATDDVDGPVATTASPASGLTFPIGATLVTVTATDKAGNKATATFNVIVTDLTLPVITTPKNMTVEATGPNGAVVTFTPTATDIVDPNPTVTTSPASGSTFPLGATTVTITATDAAGNTATMTFTVTVVDTTPPAISGVPANITKEATGPSGAVVTFPTPTATDLVDGTDPVTCSPASGSTFPFGTTTVTCTSTDAHGNTATKTFTVTVQDTTPPVISVPANITVEATGPNGAVVNFAPMASDAIDGSVTATSVPASGTIFLLGTTTVKLTASDKSGNTATATFTVTVVDTTPPAISGVPANITKEATGPSGAVVNFATPTATDLVDGTDPVTCSPASGSVFPFGTTVVTCTAKDKAGNKASATFTVTVKDTTPPVVTAAASTNSLWPPNGKMVPVLITGKITDTGSGAGSTGSYTTLDSYGQVQPSGTFTVRADGTYSFTVSLQAGRDGRDKNGRTYTLTVLGQDAAGNTTKTIVVVTVPHDQGH